LTLHNQVLTYKAFGDCSLLIEFPVLKTQDELHLLIKLQSFIRQKLQHKIFDIVISFNSLCIHFKKPFKLGKMQKKIEQMVQDRTYLEQLIYPKHWEIPVCFDPVFAMDLIEYFNGDLDQVKNYQHRICELEFTLGFYGFQPGFCYLAGLPEDMAILRKKTPNRITHKGSVAVGAQQIGIYPQDSPGGWCVFGNSPIRFFDVKRDNPLFASIGDRISFKPITIEHHEKLKGLVELGMLPLKNTNIYGDN
jgi:inhibitor of KinA